MLADGVLMIAFVRLPYRPLQRAPLRREIGPRGTVVVLALILFFQLGLLVLVFFRHWPG